MGIDGLFIILYLFFIAPMIDSNLKTSMLQQLSIPGFIMDVIKSKTSYMIYMASLGALFAVISIRWMFALHIIMLGGNNKRHFLKASGHIVKSNFRLIVKRAVGVKLMNMLMMGAAATIYILVSLLILIAFAGRHEEIVMAAIFGAGITGVFAASFLLVPFEMIRMTKLYYSIQYEPAVSLDIDSMGKSSIIDKVLGRRWVLGSLILAGVAFASYFTYTISKEFENVKYDVKITAHRGSSKDAPENTLSAIDAAARNGADYAEIDVQQTRDGRLVLLHDKSFKRTTGVDKNVWEVTLDEVKGMDAGILFGKEFEGEKVPTLEEVIDHSKGRIRLNIEIKTNGHESNIAKQVANTIAEKGIEKSCVVTSLDYSVLEEVEKLRPQIETGYIMFIALGELDRLEVDFYSVEESNIDSAFVARAHLVGRKVHAWTINTQESMENVLSAGVDNIITDNDRMLRNIIDEKNSGEGSI